MTDVTRYRRPTSPRDFPGRPDPSRGKDGGPGERTEEAGSTPESRGGPDGSRRPRRRRPMGRVWRWVRSFLSRGLPLAILAALVGVAEVSAQSVSAGELRGEVRDVLGEVVGGGTVFLLDRRSGSSRQETLRRGRFGFTFVPPGEYAVRVEVLGYRPLLVTGVSVEAGEPVNLALRMTPSAPPVTQVDTVAWFAGTASPGGVGGRRIRGGEIDGVPDLHRDLAELAALSTAMDPSLGFGGLPGSRSVIFSEGEPVQTVDHPHLHGQARAGLVFPRSALASASVGPATDDIEWAGFTGGAVRAHHRTGSARPAVGGFGFWTGDALWSGPELDETPGLTSLWGGVDASVPLVPDTALLAVALEGSRVQDVSIPTAGDGVAGRLLGEGDARLGDAFDERTAFRGSARLDWALDDGGHVVGRLGFSRFEASRASTGSALLGPGLLPSGEGTDLTGAVVVGLPAGEDLVAEIRASVSASDREWGSDDDLPGAWVVADRAWLGVDPTARGTISRLDVGGGPVLHYRDGGQQFKAGLRVDYTDYEYQYAEHSGGLLLFGDEAAADVGEGVLIRYPGTPPTVAFPVIRYSIFGQYRWTAAPGFEVATGLRWEREELPDEFPLAPTGTQALAETYETSFNKVDGRLGFTWDLADDGSTRLSGGVSLRHGVVDPAALTEGFSLDRNNEVQVGDGDVPAWPGLPNQAVFPAQRRRYALVGEDLEPPRTSAAHLSFSTRLGTGVTLSLSATTRRTEYLLRRRDLGLPILPGGTDQDGRPVYADLVIDDGVLRADPETGRRFERFEMIWARDPDGWSEYRGATVALDADLGGVGVVAEYTRSETTDNLVGASGMGSLAELVPDLPVEDWDEGTSDYDIPDRLTVTGIAPLPLPAGGALSAVLRVRSGRPFTPMVAPGLDANGDGSAFNDPAFIPTQGLEGLASEWSCLSGFQGSFPDRNACRGDPVSRLDLRLAAGLGSVGDRRIELVVDALNVTDSEEGIRDPALLLLDPQGQIVETGGGDVNVPYRVNPGFGEFLDRTDPGRWLRIGFRIGGGS